MLPRLLALFSVLALVAGPAAAQEPPFGLDIVAEGLDEPVFLTAPAGDPRLFIVEQVGRIRIIENGTPLEAPFLDVSDRVSQGGEQGLLGLAFHPDYAANGKFFVNYTDRDGATQIVAYTVSADANAADPDSATVVLSVDQPYRNHNGGWIAFGPDGLLYAGMGDGGSGGDPQGNGQNDASLLGKILRLDVDAGGAPEIIAKGVRNPWRNAFDGELLYIADVGQGTWEEVSVIAIDDVGANLGWNIMEGPDCFKPETGCDETGLVVPIASYSHDEGGCSITGGYVYRGAAIPEIAGRYFYADYCAGILQSLELPGEGAADVESYADAFGSLGQVMSFGLDSTGEMYVLTQDGTIRKFVPAP